MKLAGHIYIIYILLLLYSIFGFGRFILNVSHWPSLSTSIYLSISPLSIHTEKKREGEEENI